MNERCVKDVKDVVPINRQKIKHEWEAECGTVLYLTRGRLRTGIPMTIHKVENGGNPECTKETKCGLTQATQCLTSANLTLRL